MKLQGSTRHRLSTSVKWHLWLGGEKHYFSLSHPLKGQIQFGGRLSESQTVEPIRMDVKNQETFSCQKDKLFCISESKRHPQSFRCPVSSVEFQSSVYIPSSALDSKGFTKKKVLKGSVCDLYLPIMAKKELVQCPEEVSSGRSHTSSSERRPLLQGTQPYQGRKHLHLTAWILKRLS